jgi:hypothetical protein
MGCFTPIGPSRASLGWKKRLCRMTALSVALMTVGKRWIPLDHRLARDDALSISPVMFYAAGYG